MKRYLLTAMEYVYYEIEVEAETEQDAIDISMDERFDEWKAFDADHWDIETVEEIKDD